MNATEKLSQLLETARKASEGEWAMTSSKDLEAVVQACMLMMGALSVCYCEVEDARVKECPKCDVLPKVEKLLGGGTE